VAKLGVSAILYNTLAASDCALINAKTRQLRPSYWAAVLRRRLMGRTVLMPNCCDLDCTSMPFGQIVFGGVFDRHPNLQIAFAEGGIAWVPPALQDAEAIFDRFGNGDVIDHLDHRPSHYWHNNCYATFQNDPLGLRQIDYIGGLDS
jgi:hypothetical protein